MLGAASIPLPKNWPRNVRSAVVHAVSMANVAFTVTRDDAESRSSARIRLQAENDRLRREVSILREEIRIKDARMERVPAQRRPHARRDLPRLAPCLQTSPLRKSVALAPSIAVRGAASARSRATGCRG